mgnify:CR=1 FL=1
MPALVAEVRRLRQSLSDILRYAQLKSGHLSDAGCCCEICRAKAALEGR